MSTIHKLLGAPVFARPLCFVTDVTNWGLGAGFLELEEIDEADFGIVGGGLEDVGEDEGRAGKDRGKKKKKKKKRKRGGDDQSLSGDGDSVAQNEQEGEKEEKRAKRKRNMKKRKVKDSEKGGENVEGVADDNAEGDYIPDCCFEALTFVKYRCGVYSVLICVANYSY